MVTYLCDGCSGQKVKFDHNEGCEWGGLGE